MRSLELLDRCFSGRTEETARAACREETGGDEGLLEGEDACATSAAREYRGIMRGGCVTQRTVAFHLRIDASTAIRNIKERLARRAYRRLCRTVGGRCNDWHDEEQRGNDGGKEKKFYAKHVCIVLK